MKSFPPVFVQTCNQLNVFTIRRLRNVNQCAGLRKTCLHWYFANNLRTRAVGTPKLELASLVSHLSVSCQARTAYHAWKRIRNADLLVVFVIPWCPSMSIAVQTASTAWPALALPTQAKHASLMNWLTLAWRYLSLPKLDARTWRMWTQSHAVRFRWSHAISIHLIALLLWVARFAQ